MYAYPTISRLLFQEVTDLTDTSDASHLGQFKNLIGIYPYDFNAIVGRFQDLGVELAPNELTLVDTVKSLVEEAARHCPEILDPTFLVYREFDFIDNQTQDQFIDRLMAFAFFTGYESHHAGITELGIHAEAMYFQGELDRATYLRAAMWKTYFEMDGMGTRAMEEGGSGAYAALAQIIANTDYQTLIEQAELGLETSLFASFIDLNRPVIDLVTTVMNQDGIPTPEEQQLLDDAINFVTRSIVITTTQMAFDINQTADSNFPSAKKVEQLKPLLILSAQMLLLVHVVEQYKPNFLESVRGTFLSPDLLADSEGWGVDRLYVDGHLSTFQDSDALIQMLDGLAQHLAQQDAEMSKIQHLLTNIAGIRRRLVDAEVAAVQPARNADELEELAQFIDRTIAGRDYRITGPEFAGACALYAHFATRLEACSVEVQSRFAADVRSYGQYLAEDATQIFLEDREGQPSQLDAINDDWLAGISSNALEIEGRVEQGVPVTIVVDLYFYQNKRVQDSSMPCLKALYEDGVIDTAFPPELSDRLTALYFQASLEQKLIQLLGQWSEASAEKIEEILIDAEKLSSENPTRYCQVGKIAALAPKIRELAASLTEKGIELNESPMDDPVQGDGFGIR